MAPMLRMLLAGALFAFAAATVPACAKKPSSAETRVASAGKVTSVAGHVTVTPAGGTSHAVQDADVLASDDTIATDAGAHVDIVLAHNRALLHLDGGQTVRLDASIAWALPPQNGSAVGPSSDGLASAGRPAENDVAQTTPPPASGVARSTPQIAVAVDEQPHATAAPPPPVAQVVTPTPKPLPPRAKVSSGADANGLGAAPIMPLPVAPPPPPPPPPHSIVASPVTPLHLNPTQLGTIRACFAKPVAHATFVFSVDASTRMTGATYNGRAVSDAERTCLVSAVGMLAPGEGHFSIAL